MSRVGLLPVPVPDGVTVEINGQIVSAKGKLGELTTTLTDDISVANGEKGVAVSPNNKTNRARKLWGTVRSNINNMVIGVSEGYTRKLEINGVGYRAQVQGKELVMQLGYSHEVRFPVPEGIDIKCPDQTHITITGIDKQRVGQTAAEIRSYRKPEPYKGKGIKYEGEYILRKEGKKK